MKLNKPFYSLLLCCLFAFAALAQAGDDLVYVIWSLNSRAEILMVKRDDEGKHKILAHISRDMTADEAYLNYGGNVADYEKPNHRNAAAFARQLVVEMVELQPTVFRKEGIDPDAATFSVLYSVAGIDAADGEYPKTFNPWLTRQVLRAAEDAIDEEFHRGGITLKTIQVSRDSALIGEAMKLKDPEPHLLVFKTTYDLLCLKQGKSTQTHDMKMPDLGEEATPSGSIFGIGAIASNDIISGHEAPVCEAEDDDAAACKDGYRDRNQRFRDRLNDAIIERGGDALDEKAMNKRFSAGRNNNLLGDLTLFMAKKGLDSQLESWFNSTMETNTKPTLAAILRYLPVIKEQLILEGLSHQPVVYVMGDYARINRMHVVADLYKLHSIQHNYSVTVVDDEEARELLARAGINKLDQLVEARK